MAKKEELSYASAVEQIEEIIARLNEESVDIDRLSEYVGRATELIEFCKKRLAKAESEVSKLLEE